MLHYSEDDLNRAAQSRHIETEQDALAFAIGLLMAYAGDESVPIDFRRLGLEAHDALIERARDIGLDLSHYDPLAQTVRDAIAVDGRNIDDVPSGDNSSV